MTEAPVVTTPPAPAEPDEFFSGMEDYWGTDDTTKVHLPDGKQYFIVKPMNEGEKSKFQKMTTKDVVLQQRTGDARMAVDPAGERHALIKASVVGWKMYKRSSTGAFEEVGYSKQMLEKWLETANPKAVEKVEHGIRLVNPWLQGDMTVKDIDEELDRLADLRKQIVDREAGEADSANK